MNDSQMMTTLDQNYSLSSSTPIRATSPTDDLGTDDNDLWRIIHDHNVSVANLNI